MRHKLLYMLLLMGVAALGIVVKVYVFDAQAAQLGLLRVNSSPEAKVFIDSKAIDRTPLTYSLKPGEYVVKLIPLAEDGNITDGAGVPWEGTVRIQAFAQTVVRRELRITEVESAGEVLTVKRSDNPVGSGMGEILVETEPTGAIVSFDGQDVGVSPYLIKNASVGVHEISVYAPRFRRRTAQVRVQPGGYTTVASFSLGVDSEYATKFAFADALEASRSAMLPDVPVAPASPTPTPQVAGVEILETPTGFLRVREAGTFGAREIAQVRPGETYTYLGEEGGWTNIKLTDGQEGWVSSEYVKKVYEGEGDVEEL